MYHFFSRVLFLFGFMIGVILALIIIKLTDEKTEVNLLKARAIKSLNESIYQKWFASTSLVRKRVSLDSLRYSEKKLLTEAEYLYNKVKILCVILVHNVRNADAARNTWTKGCNGVEYVNIDTKIKKKIIPIKRTKENSSWVLLCKSLLNVTIDYNWILVVNDDTFALLENLRLLVAGLDSTKGYYLGHAVTFWATTYNMGQAGYVLSRGSLSAIKTKFNTTDFCTSEITYLNQEDMYLGKHLAALNISPADTRDIQGLTRFHPYNWNQVFFPGATYYKYSVYPVICCSKHSITFQAIEAHKMYMYYYLLYNLQIFNGGHLGNRPAPTPIPETEVWQSFLRKRNISNTNVSSKVYFQLWEELVHDPTAFAQEIRKGKYDYV